MREFFGLFSMLFKNTRHAPLILFPFPVLVLGGDFRSQTELYKNVTLLVAGVAHVYARIAFSAFS